MKTKITIKLKKVISTLVCVMMVFGIFPAHALNSSVFAGNELRNGVQTSGVPNATWDEDLSDAEAVEVANDIQDIEMEGGAVCNVENFGQLKDAVENSPNVDTIILNRNIEVTNEKDFALTVKGKKIKIMSDSDLDIKTITCKGKGSLFKIDGEKSGVTLANVAIDGNRDKGGEKEKSLIEVEKGFLILESGGKIFNCSYKKNGRAICCKEGVVNIESGGEISECSAQSGGAIHCEQGIVNIENGGKISKCSAQFGGAIHCKESMIEINGGEISKCGAQLGGVIYCEGGVIEINGGKIFECSAKYGGAIDCRNAKVNIENGGKIFNCEAQSGGAIDCENVEVNIGNGGEISKCSSKESGGAILAVGGSLNINGGEISKCSAKEDGGAIYCERVMANILGGNIIGCYAKYGGAMSASGGSVNITGGNITGCYAKKCGNAIYVETWGKAEGIVTLSLIEHKSKKPIIKLDDKAKGKDTDFANTGGYEGIYLAGGAEFKVIRDNDDKGEDNDIKNDNENDDKNEDNDIKNDNENNIEGDNDNENTARVENFEQLKDAVDSPNVDTIILTSNIEVTNEKDFALTVKGKTIKIMSDSDLDIKTITCKGKGSLLKIDGEESGVTLENVAIDGNRDKGYVRENSLIEVEKGFLKLESGGKIFKCSAQYGGAISCKKGTIEINGGKIYKCSAKYGGAICCVRGTVNMNGGEIFNCSAYVKGGAIDAGDGSVNITGGSIIGCYANALGNAIYVYTVKDAENVATLSLIEHKNNKPIIKLDYRAEGKDTDSANTGGYKGIWLGEGAEFKVIRDDDDIKNDNENNIEGGNDDENIARVENFEQLKDAVENSPNVDTIILNRNIEVTSENDDFALTVKGKTIKIMSDSDLDIKTITCKGKGSLLKVDGEESGVTLENVAIDGNRDKGDMKEKSLIEVEKGFLKLESGGKIFNCNAIFGGAISCKKGTIEISGGEISECSAEYGGAMNCKESMIEINGGEISKCSAKEDGGAIRCENTEVTIEKGGKIFNCESNAWGGAICAKDGSVNVNGGEISKCSTKFAGGAIRCENVKVYIEKGGKIFKCSAKFGGAMNCEQGIVYIEKGGKIFKCSAKFGGAIDCEQGIVHIENGGEISECSAKFNGGAIRCENAKVTVEKGGKIFNCQSDNWGGAMWFFGKTMDINGGEIFECSAESGGAIYCGAGKVNILGGNITGCYAKKFGNVVYMRTWEEAEVVATLSLIEQKNNRLTIKLDDNAKGEDTDSVNTDGYKGIYIAEGAVCETI